MSHEAPALSVALLVLLAVMAGCSALPTMGSGQEFSTEEFSTLRVSNGMIHATKHPDTENVTDLPSRLRTDCAFAAGRAAKTVVTSRLDLGNETMDAGLRFMIQLNETDAYGTKYEIVVERVILLNRSDEPVLTPNVSYQRVEEVTPREAEMTFRLENRSFTCTVPINARNYTAHQTGFKG